MLDWSTTKPAVGSSLGRAGGEPLLGRFRPPAHVPGL